MTLANDLEHRLADALDTGADAVPDTAAPAFSWQSAAPISDRTRRLPRRSVYAGAGLVAAGVAAVVVATLPGGTGSPSTARALGSQSPSVRSTSAAPTISGGAPTVLLAAARTRLRDGDPVLQDGQFRYIRIVSQAPVAYVNGGSAQQPPHGSYSLDQYWIPKDETNVWMRRSSVVGDPGIGAADVWQGRCGDLYAKTQDGPKGPACTRPGSFEDPTPTFVASLPRDADALYARLHAFARQRLNPDKIHDVGFVMFTTVDSLLQSGIVTSDLTSTFYRVLSRIPGIEVVDGERNYSGTVGTGLRLSTVLGHGADATPDTQTIIIDRNSGGYLGDENMMAGYRHSSAVTTGVADHLGQPAH